MAITIHSGNHISNTTREEGALEENVKRNLSLFEYFGQKTHHQEGDILFNEGDPGREMLVVVSGVIELHSNYTIFDSVGPFQIIGEMAIIDGGNRTARAQCATDVTVIRVDLARFRWIIKIDTSFAEVLLSTLSNRIRALNQMATIDALTGAFSRGHYELLAEREFKRSVRHETDLAVLTVDIDHFKSINDRFGHNAGDRVLARLVDAMKSVFRPSDVIGRIGGEEFAILLPQTNQSQALVAADRLVEHIKQAEIVVDGGDVVGFTLSGGISGRRPEDEFISQIQKRADKLLYQAKNTGRNRVLLDSERP